MKNIRNTILFVALAASSFDSARANESVRIQGFGSVVGASVIDGPGYIAEYPNLGIYDEETFDFGQESRFGLQVTGDINEKLYATVQLMFRGANEFDSEVAWAYLSYEASAEGTLQMGRLRVPVYHFSEYMDVGYAYPWLRIPADTYSLDLINFNGLRYSHQFQVGDASLSTTVSYGNQNNTDSELMGYLFPEQIDRDFSDITGLVIGLEFDNIELRTSYVQADMLDTRHLSSFLATNILFIPESSLYPSNTGLTDASGDALVATDTQYDISFFDISAKITAGQFSFFLEYNKYDPFYESYFGSISYAWEDMQFYALYSKFDLDEAWESHDTKSLGLRYDFMPNVAFKADISIFSDTGYNPFTLDPNPVYAPAKLLNGGDGDGDATILSFGIDFVF